MRGGSRRYHRGGLVLYYDEVEGMDAGDDDLQYAN